MLGLVLITYCIENDKQVYKIEGAFKNLNYKRCFFRSRPIHADHKIPQRFSCDNPFKFMSCCLIQAMNLSQRNLNYPGMRDRQQYQVRILYFKHQAEKLLTWAKYLSSFYIKQRITVALILHEELWTDRYFWAKVDLVSYSVLDFLISMGMSKFGCCVIQINSYILFC